MLTPPRYGSDMPPLVDPQAFVPPPPGAIQGGQPTGSFFEGFPSLAPPQNIGAPWPSFGGTPNPQSPTSLHPPPQWGGYPYPPAASPNGAGATFGQQPQQNGFAGYPATAYTPWSAQPPATPVSANPFSASGYPYPPWSAPAGAVAGGYTPFGQPPQDGVTAGGFFGANGVTSAGGGAAAGGWGTWGDADNQGWGPVSKKKKRRSDSMKRTISADYAAQWVASNSRSTTPAATPLQRSASFGGGVGGSPFAGGASPFHGGGSPFGAGGHSPFGGGGGAFYSPFGGPASGYPPWGAFYSPPPGPDEPGPRNLARRPRDWRPDYSPKGRLSSYIPSLMGKSRSDVKEYTDPHRRTLHPLLQWSATYPPIEHDLRLNPFTIPADNLFIRLGRSHNRIDFAQLATTPACALMRLYHPSLPWFVDVKQSHANGVTVHDVLLNIFKQLLCPIQGRHFWNEEMGEGEREAVCRAFAARCAGDQAVIALGVCQVDFLGRRVVFEGLVRGKNGNWEMKLRKGEPE